MVDPRRELHVLVTDVARRHVLVEPGDPVRLPIALTEVGDGRTTVSAAVAALRQRLGIRRPILEVHFAYEMPHDEGPVPVLTVVEPIDAADAPDGLAWQPLALPDPAASRWLVPRVAELLAEWRTGAEPPPLRPRWAREGWHARATSWFRDRLAEVGRPAVGEIEQVRHWGISALLRAETSDGAAWLKAVFPPFHHEPAATRLLADAFPSDVPTVLATEPQEGWLVTADLGGATVGDTKGGPAEATTPALLARIQRAMAARTGELIALGCPIRPLDGLLGEIEAIVWERPPLAGMTLDDAAARRAVERTQAAVRALASVRIPDTLIHGDFHSGNVALVDARPVIFDWSDAAVGNPLMDVATWLDRIDEPDRREAAWSAFMEAWVKGDSRRRLRDALPDVLAAGAAYQAVSYAGILRNLEPLRRWENADGLEEYLRQLVGLA